jgi:DNA-binding transcriptional regulator YbjK
MTGKTSNYQGRQTSRKASGERRIRILEAAMRIIVREGTRGVRHRSVAAEADVPLAATTYYFEHINDLISDAFVLFYERLRQDDRLMGEVCYQFITDHSPEQLKLKETRVEMADQLASILTGHIQNQTATPEDRILEMAFRAEALHNPLLRKLVYSNIKEILWLIERSLR